MNVSSISTGFIDISGQITHNIYVQGCSIGCPGCQNPSLQPFDGGIDMSPSTILSIIESRPLPKWVCWLGGDATFQPTQFKYVNLLLKSKGYKIGIYTGRLFNEVSTLFQDVDLVIDGPYVESLGGADIKGTNQKCYFKKNGIFTEITFDQILNTITNNQ